MKLKRATFRHIEAEIHEYDKTLEAIRELRRDVIEAGRGESYAMAVGQGQWSSPVERRATRLADWLLLREMERITSAIRDTYAVAREDCRRVLWIKYGLAINWNPPPELAEAMRERNRYDMRVSEMAALLGMDESTFHRYRTGFVYGVAERLGWW